MKLRQVMVYHADIQARGANMQFMAFYKPDGSGQWYTRGWVVSGYKGEDSHYFLKNKALALSFMDRVDRGINVDNTL